MEKKKRMVMDRFFSVKDTVERKRMLKNYTPEAKRNMMFSARRKTKRAVKWLFFYVNNLQNTTDHPDLELSRVFSQQDLLDWNQVTEAMLRGIIYHRSKMLTQEQIDGLSADLATEGILHEPLRLYHDEKYRHKKQLELFQRKPHKREAIIQKMLDGKTVSYNEMKTAFS